MGNKILYLIPLVCISCLSDSKSEEKAIILSTTNHQVKIDSTYQTNENIIGKWGIYVRINEGLEMRCNVCPDIVFNKDLTGEIIKASSEEEQLQWKTVGKKITLRNISSNPPNTIKDGQYNIAFKQEKEYKELKLTDLETGYSYILRK
jgi:hypothetical protein